MKRFKILSSKDLKGNPQIAIYEVVNSTVGDWDLLLYHFRNLEEAKEWIKREMLNNPHETFKVIQEML